MVEHSTTSNVTSPAPIWCHHHCFKITDYTSFVKRDADFSPRQETSSVKRKRKSTEDRRLSAYPGLKLRHPRLFPNFSRRNCRHKFPDLSPTLRLFPWP